MIHSATDYLHQAARNSELADYLRSEKHQHLDWAATCLFYAAVHYVNAYLRTRNIPIPRRHTGDQRRPGRTNIVQQDPCLKSIYKAYRHLDDESRDARYELKIPNIEDYDKFLLPRLVTIQNFIVPKVSN